MVGGSALKNNVLCLILIAVCGDSVCATEEGEACDTCPSDCGRCPLNPWEIALVIMALVLVIAVLSAVVLVRKQFKLNI